MHDHAESQRRREEEERRGVEFALAREREVNLVLEGAVRRIASRSTTHGQREIAETAINAIRKLREHK